MNYRQDLVAAHLRIAHLEQELAMRERDRSRPDAQKLRDAAPDIGSAPDPGSEPEPGAEAHPVAVGAAGEWWRAWPFVALVASVVTYGVRFGTSMPTELLAVDHLTPLSQGSTFGAILGAALMVLVYILRRADGASSVGQRFLTMVAVIINGPLIVIGGLALLEAGAMIGTIIAGVVMALGAAFWLYKWIARGES